jgi:predicted nucleic acid-binding protein
LILVDSSFFIGYFNKNDQWHKKALKIGGKIENQEKVISNLIISETITQIGNLFGGKAGKITYEHLIDNYIVFKENRDIYNKSMEIFLKYDGKLSLADSLSIVIMKELNIHEIASFDADFDNKKGIVRLY